MFDALLPGDRAVTLVVQGWFQRSVRCESAPSLKIVFANTGFTMVVDKTKQNKHREGELYIVAVFFGGGIDIDNDVVLKGSFLNTMGVAHKFAFAFFFVCLILLLVSVSL